MKNLSVLKKLATLSLVAASVTTSGANATEVYLTPLQCADLGNLSNQSKWPIVRDELHGLWFNNAGNSNDETRRIIMRLTKNAHDIIVPISFGQTSGSITYLYPAWDRYLAISATLPSNKTLSPTHIMFDSIVVAEGNMDLNAAIRAINAAENDSRFGSALSGVTFSPRHGLEDQSNGVGTYFWRTKRLINEVEDMVAIEMAPWRFDLPRAREGFKNIHDYARARGLKFVWLANRGVGTNNSDWISDIENAFVKMQQNSITLDVIAVSNQGDTTTQILPRVPSTNQNNEVQDTITGGLLLMLDEYGWVN